MIFDDSRGGVVAGRRQAAHLAGAAGGEGRAGRAWKPAAPYSYKANAPIFTEFADATDGATKAT